MPHAVENDEDDDKVIAELTAGGAIPDLGTEAEEKAADAEDFEDIGDDDLADEEDDVSAQDLKESSIKVPLPLDVEPDDEQLDDLFGDEPSSPLVEDKDAEATPKHSDGLPHALAQSSTLQDLRSTEPKLEVEVEDEDDEDPELKEQRRLFARSGHKLWEPPPAPTTDAEVFNAAFPQFEANKPPRFGELLPLKRANYIYKQPLKPPKPVNPTKVNLEIQQDQEKAFRLPDQPVFSTAARIADAETRGLILVVNQEPITELSKEDEADFEVLDDDADIAGVKWQDIVALCTDWDVPFEDGNDDGGLVGLENEQPTDQDGLFDEFGDGELIGHPAKKQKTAHSHSGDPLMFSQQNISFDNPQLTTSELARKVRLDLNDPDILVDLEQPHDMGRKRKAAGTFKRDAAGGLTKDFSRRYNISNDEAYDLLKENHQSKVRSVLGSVAIEHSLPAVRLQYPFYKVKLSPKDARTFHRPSFTTQAGLLVHFDKPAFVKRKHLKGRDAQSLFSKSKDLSIGDNSNIFLLEYSEEYPVMLSGFGMGSKLINYYRRKDNEDTSRPKLDVGETQILLPQDKSPFAIFGDVDRGQMTPTIHNGMFRAPVFKHEPAQTDFLISRNWTHVEGANWYLRNIENLHVAGQEFPLVEVPGTHSRKVTDAAKKRLRMVSYRMFRRHKKLRNEMILDHLPGSDIAANRSKMREFMDYDKDRGWVPRKNETIPEEPEIRAMVKPEDVCLLYSMQVGDRQLQDAGYNKDDEDMEVEEEDEDTADIDKQLAPWQLTKNFLNACQGKAMLKLHGEGDPSGRGEAFNFIRTSMKGGFKEVGESIQDKLDALSKKKELGGHSYNVAKQQNAYNSAIRRIWQAQARSLSSTIEHDADMADVEEEAGTPAADVGRTPASAAGRPRRDDETGSLYSKTSTSADAGKVLRITRTYRDKYGKEETKHEIIRDSKVIREYQRRRRQIELSEMSLESMRKTGDSEYDAQQQKILRLELARLERNKDRRIGREKAKGVTSAASPSSSAASPTAGDTGAPATPVPGSSGGKRNAPGGTQRKCANCGQVGHIKTNKKLCSVCEYMTTPIKHLAKGLRLRL